MSDEVTQYGFTWGPVVVTRMTTLPGDRRVLRVKVGDRNLDIYVSRTGRSVRVFDSGRELKPTA